MKRKKIIRIENPVVESWAEIEIPSDYTYPRTVSSLLTNLISENISSPELNYFSDLLSLWHEGETGYKYDIKLSENDVSKVTWEFAKIILDKNRLKEIKLELEYSPRQNKVTKDILKSKLPKPSYLRHKKIAKELFGLK